MSPLLALAGVWGESHGVLIASICGSFALTANCCCTYWAARIFGLKVINKFIFLFRKKPISIPEDVKQSNFLVWSLVMRLTPGIPFIFTNIILGALKMPFQSYILISVPILTLSSFGYIYATAGIISGNYVNFGGGIAIILGFFIVGRFILKRRKKMQSELFQTRENNSKIWEISEINASIRKILESNLSNIWIRGEISNLKSHSSGHHYFQLKDSLSQIKAVLFKGDARNQTCLPKEGGNFIIFGDLTAYEPRGDCQIRVKYLLEEGSGNLKLEFERLKKSLMREGLFDSDKKKPIPKYITRVGLVTSKEGAAIEDFTSILQRRDWCGEIISLFFVSTGGHCSQEPDRGNR